ncbi:MAG: Na+/H+ antiporter NhaC family protein [Aerococcus sp.]|nr:Na+/H+ antiporter NhaC family protein [Aerococcus sp.]
MEKQTKVTGKVLLPFITFVGLYLIVGISLTLAGNDNGFYALPASVSVIAGIIVAFIVYDGSIDEKVGQIISGCGESNIIIMLIIFLLAGAFGKVTAEIGGVNAIVNLGISVIPPSLLVPGMFLIACFVCLAIGTSMGTIATIAPICVSLSEAAHINMALLIAALLGGAMFGNTMAIIADTQIVTARVLDINIKDKFLINLRITGLAVLITSILYFVLGPSVDGGLVSAESYQLIKILPYILVLGGSLLGGNVFVVLTLGIIFAGGVGVIYQDFTVLEFTQTVHAGFASMFDVSVFSFLIGGLANMVNQAGGITWINQKLQKLIRGRRSAMAGAMILPGAVDMALANDTVSVLITGSLIKDLSDRYQIDRRVMGTLMHTTVCIVQGLLPYGAQVLLATGFTNGKVSPLDVFPYHWYAYTALLLCVATILISKSKVKKV